MKKLCERKKGNSNSSMFAACPVLPSLPALPLAPAVKGKKRV